MQIRCPRCSYSREVDEGTIKPSVTLATCPECAHRFRFREAMSETASFELSAAVQTTEDTQETPQSIVAGLTSQDSTPPDSTAPANITPDSASNTIRETLPVAEPEREGAQVSSPRPLRAVSPSPDPEREEQFAQGDGPLPSWAQKKIPTTEVWADMRKVGVVRAFIETTRQIFLTPQAFFASMSKDVSFLVPFSYYMLSSMLGILLETIWQTAVGNPVLPEAFSGTIGSGEELLQLVLLSPVVMTFYLYLLAGVLHLVLMLTGVAKSGTSTTLRVVCYSSAADLLSVIPVVGTLIGGLWRLWLIVVGLRTVYSTTTARILPAVGVLFLSLLVVVAIVLRDLGVM